MTPKELGELVATARELGLRKLKTAEVEIELVELPAARSGEPARLRGRRTPTGMEFLLWSTDEPLPFEMSLNDAEYNAALRSLNRLAPPDAGKA